MDIMHQCDTRILFTFVLLASLRNVTSQPPFDTLPYTASIPETITDNSVIHEVFIIPQMTPVVYHDDYMIQYDPVEAEQIFTAINMPYGFDVIVVNGSLLDYETPPNQYTISFIDMGFFPEGSGESFLSKRQAETGGVVGVLTIDITNMNEPPVFETHVLYANVPETQGPMDDFITLPSNAIDMDAGDTISYEIYDIFPPVFPPLIFFGINSTNGNIKLLGDYDVDDNVHPEVIIITIAAVDAAGLSSTVMLIVTVLGINDNVPIFTENGNYIMILPFDYAGVTGTRIGYVHADDRDNDVITYVMETRQRYFMVDGMTGIITLSSPIPVETSLSGMYSFSVIAIDETGISNRKRSITPATTALATVTVYIVPFCTDREKQEDCDICATTNGTTTAARDTVPAGDVATANRASRAIEGPALNTCPQTTCSRCRDYISSTCPSGAPFPSPDCPSTQNEAVSAANIDVCWIIPLVIAVIVASIILAYCFYKRQKMKVMPRPHSVAPISTAFPGHKPRVTPIGPSTDLVDFNKPEIIP